MSSPSDHELERAAKQATASLDRLVDIIDQRVERGIKDSDRVGSVKAKSALREVDSPLDIITGEFMAWKADAACRGVEARWFDIPPIERSKQREVMAVELAICASCPVIGECLDHALEFNEPEGIWGGKLPWERRRLRKQRVR
jgi:WhiB family redox-sensing transcriptional regulator